MITDKYVLEALDSLATQGPPAKELEPLVHEVRRAIRQGKYQPLQLPPLDQLSSQDPLLLNYVALLCYYILTNQCLLQLPPAYEAARYFKAAKSTRYNQMLYSLQTAPERLWKSLPGLPTAWPRSDLRKRYNECERFARHYTAALGRLMVEFRASDKLALEDSLEQKLKALRTFLKLDSANMAQIVQETQNSAVVSSTTTYRVPSLATRYWPVALLVLCYGPTSLVALWHSRRAIQRFLQENVVDFARGLLYNWVYVPLKQVWATVRHDEDSSIAVMSKGTLDSESSSLTRMVVRFVRENSSQSFDEDKLVSQVEHGDLTEFLEIYENQLEKPVRNLITGALVRSLLIQLQKTKVDGSLALSGIDRMLQSQQLVFGVVALSPALLIIYTTSVSAYRLCKVGKLWSYEKQHREILSQSLNNAERLLNYDDEQKEIYYNQGLLAIEVTTVFNMGLTLVPRSRWPEWTRDVAEIADSKLSLQSRLNVITRIYHTYGKFF